MFPVNLLQVYIIYIPLTLGSSNNSLSCIFCCYWTLYVLVVYGKPCVTHISEIHVNKRRFRITMLPCNWKLVKLHCPWCRLRSWSAATRCGSTAGSRRRATRGTGDLLVILPRRDILRVICNASTCIILLWNCYSLSLCHLIIFDNWICMGQLQVCLVKYIRLNF